MSPQLVRAPLVSPVLDEFGLCYPTAGTLALHHGSTIFSFNISFTPWNTLSLFLLFNAIGFNHYTYMLDIFEVIDDESMIDTRI